MGKWQYGVILDAGSSGTRVYVYKWLKNSVARKGASPPELRAFPAIETDSKWTKKTHPGVSTFGKTPSLVGPDHLQDLLQHALDIVPRDEVPNTPFFLLATAGMRLLLDRERNEVLEQICTYTREKTDFLLPDCDLHIQVIPGETEGMYGWLAVNYLLGGFDAPDEHDHGSNHSTYGFLDMGGASAQIAFAPNATEAEKHANDLKLIRLRTIDGAAQVYKLFTTTWLEFGVNEARRRYVEALLAEMQSPSVIELPDPCLPTGMRMTIHSTPLPKNEHPPGNEPFIIGTGNFAECLKRSQPLLNQDLPCTDAPCLINGLHTPAIDFNVNHFVGISEYWHTTHEIFEFAHKDKSYDFATYQERVAEFCSRDWTDIQADVAAKTWGKKVDEQTAYEVCFKASWIINMLHVGIGVPRVPIEGLGPSTYTGGGANATKELNHKSKPTGYTDPFQAVNKIHATEVSWTLGKMVLYASSQILPLDNTTYLPVGYGNNTPTAALGVTADWRYPAAAHCLRLCRDADRDRDRASKIRSPTRYSPKTGRDGRPGSSSYCLFWPLSRSSSAAARSGINRSSARVFLLGSERLLSSEESYHEYRSCGRVETSRMSASWKTAAWTIRMISSWATLRMRAAWRPLGAGEQRRGRRRPD